MEFEFDNQLTPQKLIDIENIGYVALEAYNSNLGSYYYYIIKSVMGKCLVASCGPIVPDVECIPSGFCINMYKMEYSDYRLIKAIDTFLNDRAKGITEAKEIDMDEAIDQFRDIAPYLRDVNVDNF